MQVLSHPIQHELVYLQLFANGPVTLTLYKGQTIGCIVSHRANHRSLDADAWTRNLEQMSRKGQNSSTDSGRLQPVEATSGFAPATSGQVPLFGQAYLVPWVQLETFSAHWLQERWYDSLQEFVVSLRSHASCKKGSQNSVTLQGKTEVTGKEG